MKIDLGDICYLEIREERTINQVFKGYFIEKYGCVFCFKVIKGNRNTLIFLSSGINLLAFCIY